MKLVCPVMEISERISMSSRREKSGSFTSIQPPETVMKKKIAKLEKKRKFTDDQIRALEFMFESEEKLEPRKKVHIARELGLKPRQIAIWFQNRRARWKTKRIEQDYRKIKIDYDNLVSRFENLKKEKDSLQEELLKLGEVMGGSEAHEATGEKEMIKGSSNNGDGRSMTRWELADRTVSFSSDQGHRLEDKAAMDSHNDKNLNGPLTSAGKWYSVDPCGMFDQSTNSHWLDFWT